MTQKSTVLIYDYVFKDSAIVMLVTFMECKPRCGDHTKNVFSIELDSNNH